MKPILLAMGVQSAGPMKLFAWGQTDVGSKRDHNEDSFLVAPDMGLFVIADGMGGHQGGDRASSRWICCSACTCAAYPATTRLA